MTRREVRIRIIYFLVSKDVNPTAKCIPQSLWLLFYYIEDIIGYSMTEQKAIILMVRVPWAAQRFFPIHIYSAYNMHVVHVFFCSLYLQRKVMLLVAPVFPQTFGGCYYQIIWINIATVVIFVTVVVIVISFINVVSTIA